MGMVDPNSYHPSCLNKALHFYPCSCLRTSNIWEGRIVIFPISHELVGILIFVFLSFLMNKRIIEIHKSY